MQSYRWFWATARATLMAASVAGYVTASAGQAFGAAANVGAVGDSLTDEYQFWGPIFYKAPTARNWVDQLAVLRSSEVNFGTYKAWDPLALPGGPRYTGFEFNYARLGATSTTLLGEGQHTGVSGQPVQYVYLGIGTNDFSAVSDADLGVPFGLVNNYGGIYAGGDPTAIVDGLVARFTTALNQIAGPSSSPTGVKVIVGNVGDWGDLPMTTTRGYTDPAGKAKVTAAIMDANAQIQSIAFDRGIPVVDVFGLLKLTQGPDPLTVGDVSLTFGSPASNNPAFVFLPDRIHPGTVWQGLVANTVVGAGNLGYGAGWTPLSDQEILATAGLADPHGGAITSYYSVAPYVLVVPEPSTAALLGIGVLLSSAAGVARRLRPAARNRLTNAA